MGLTRAVWYKQEWGLQLGEGMNERVQDIKVRTVAKLRRTGRSYWGAFSRTSAEGFNSARIRSSSRGVSEARGEGWDNS